MDHTVQRGQHLRLRQQLRGLSRQESLMTITVTPKAANKIRQALVKRGGGVGLRVAVKTSVVL